ncbi:hypothetical protein ACQP3L_29455, partial [Escherichia coli]
SGHDRHRIHVGYRHMQAQTPIHVKGSLKQKPKTLQKIPTTTTTTTTKIYVHCITLIKKKKQTSWGEWEEELGLECKK